MPLKLMYITNQPEVAKIAECSGVDRIFVDMEYIGKADRQGGMDTVQSKHTFEDVRRIRETIHSSELLVRVNPIHDAAKDYCSSKKEIDEVISRGADIIMLPYFKKAEEVQNFIELVGGRAKTIPLVETPEAVENIDEILKINGIDEIFIGLNDLSLGYNKNFMFELLTDGTVENLCCKFRQKNIPFGFGGIASIGKGLLPSEYVIREHYRLGSTCSILSRSFCNVNNVKSLEKISDIFVNEIAEIRNFEKECEVHSKYFFDNLSDIRNIVKSVIYK